MHMLSWFKNEKTAATTEITISNHTVLRVTILVIVTLLLVSALRTASHALLLIFTGLFLALALNAPVHWLSEHLPGKSRGSRTIATAISFIFVIAVLIGFIASIVPPLVRQTSSFIQEAPQLVEDVRNENTSLGNFVRRYRLESQVDKLSSQLSNQSDNITGTAVNTFSRISGSIFSTLTVLVLAFMMLIEGSRWMNFFRRLVPKPKRAHVEGLVDEMYKVVKGYVNGQVLLAALAATLIVIPLVALDVSYPIALMVIVFFCGLIPMVGHTIGAAIITVVALFHSLPAALFMLGYYILYQQIENYAVQPKIQANSTNMSPLLVFMSVVIGVSFGGLFGGLVAIPVAGCLRILALDFMESRDLISPAEADAVKTAKA